MFLIMRVETNAVGYWCEGTGFVASSDDATVYGTRQEATDTMNALRNADRWSYLLHGITLVVIPD